MLRARPLPAPPMIGHAEDDGNSGKEKDAEDHEDMCLAEPGIAAPSKDGRRHGDGHDATCLAEHPAQPGNGGHVISSQMERGVVGCRLGEAPYRSR